MLSLVCHHPHCNAEATERIAHPRVTWLLCAHHAEAEHRLTAALLTDANAPGCRVPGCTRPRHSRGWCSPHYQQALRRGLREPDSARPLRRDEARAALQALPRVPPLFSLPASEHPAWIRRSLARHSTDAWAQLRQELHRIAELPL